MHRLYDTHAHLDFPEFANDLGDVVARARENGVEKIITVGTNLASSKHAVALAERFPWVYAVVGWHPNDADDAPADVKSALRELAAHRKVVALGETGLDYHRLPGSHDGEASLAREQKIRKQKELFKQHLELAAELGLNVVVHQRDAFEDTLSMLRPFAGRIRAVFHCFGESPARLEQVLALGAFVSFTGIVTFKNAEVVREAVYATPLDRLMIETDCPFLAPVPYRGKRCEPAHLREIAFAVAQIKGCSIETVSNATCENAEAFFRGLSKS
ncbi:MAG: TatD family hydrolase [Verrucomicrobiae bacterium]|nr:TatD family hydrolase [Verrucomicrobiae bacterium]